MTDLTLQEAINETQKFARMLKGLEKLSETAAAFANAEQVIAERKAQATKIDAEIATAVDQLAETKIKAATAKTKAAKLVDEAEAKAKGIVTEAEDKARAAQAEAEAAVTLAHAELAQVRDDLASKRAQVIAAEAELAGVVKRTADAREAARKLIGEG